MKTALLHYLPANMCGGKNVFAEIAGLFPAALDVSGFNAIDEVAKNVPQSPFPYVQL